MELRKTRLLITKAGGSAGSGSVKFRTTLPTSWIRDMGLSEDDRDIDISYNEETKEIIIRKEVVHCIECGNGSESIMVSDNDGSVSKYYTCKDCGVYFKQVFKVNSRKLIEEKVVDVSEMRTI